VNDSQCSIRNHLLRTISSEVFQEIAPHLKRSALSPRMLISEADKPIENICFPEGGVISVVARSRNGGRIEAGLIGSEGFCGAAIMLADDRSPNEAFVQCPGDGLWIAAGRLLELASEAPELRRVLLRYVHAFMIQTAHTALADGRARLDQRLARWLLMAQDRVGGPQLHLTHEVLSTMLGVRRAGVTVALAGLERMGAIRMTRGVVTVVDRAMVESLAAGWYGVPEREYRRLLGDPGWEPRAAAAA
jgi:CRP-like cAMP-binding protein